MYSRRRCGRRRRWPTRCSARCPRRSARPRSTRSSPATPPSPSHCAEGGFDGIELQCSHSSIVRGFLSPATNRRTDAYGGALANRARLLLEIVAAVRSAIGPGLALGVRICGDELIDGGTTIDDAVAVARLVEADRRGRLRQHVDRCRDGDAVHDRGVDARARPATRCSSRRRSAGRRSAGGRSRAVQGPAAGRARPGRGPLRPRRRRARPDRRRRVRRQGARRGRPSDIRLCLSCNQECVGRMGLNRWLGCIENPTTGREAVEARTDRAGDEPSRRARDRRRTGRAPGGDRRRRRRPPRDGARARRGGGRAGAPRRVGAEPRRARRHGPQPGRPSAVASVSSSSTASTPTSPTCAHERARTTSIVATGAVAQRPWWVGRRRRQRVRRPRRAHRLRRAPPAEWCVIDEIGFHHATSVAELLADRGCAVEVVTNGDGRRPGPGDHPRHGAVVDAGDGQVDRPGDGPRADGFRRHHAHAAPPPDGARRAAHAGLGGARRAGRRRPTRCSTGCRAAGSGSFTRRARGRLRRAPAGPRRRGRGPAGRAHVPARAGRADGARGRVAQT